MALLLLTRPQEAARRLLADLTEALGAPPRALIAPLMEIVPLPVADPAPGGDVVLSSPAAAARAADLGFAGVAWCVGESTAQAARALGFEAHASAGDAAHMIPDIIAAAPPRPLTHIRGTHSRGDVAARLTEAGLPCRALIAYDQRALPLSAPALRALRGEERLVIPLFSPRSAALFAKAAEGASAPMDFIAISAAAAEPLSGVLPGPVIVAQRPDIRDMKAGILRALRRGASVDRFSGG